MQITGLVEYTPNDIERLARDYLASRVDFTLTIPVKVDVLLQTTPNVQFDTIEGLARLYEVEGAVFTKLLSPDLYVFIDRGIIDSHDDARYNAAVGEELGHIQIHRAILMQCDSVETFIEWQSHPNWPKYELDARNYSAAIRMPCQLVDQAAQEMYAEVVDQLGFSQSRQIERAINARMAERFVVSLGDMDRRLLTWPCEIYRRVQRSVVDCSPYLLGGSPLERIHPYRIIQQKLPHF